MKTSSLVKILSLLVIVAKGDECEGICSLIPGSCSSKGSYCKGGHACMDLFWYSENAVLCNHENVVCAGRREVRCSEAREIVSSGNSRGIVAFVSLSSSTSAPPSMHSPAGLTSPVVTATSAVPVSSSASPASPVISGGSSLSSLLRAARGVVDWSLEELGRAPENAQAKALIFATTTQYPRYQGLGVDSSVVLPMMESILTSAGEKDRCMYLIEFMLEPVNWFWFTQTSLVTLRECCRLLVEHVREDDNPQLIEAVSLLIELVYSPTTEAFLRIPRSDLPADIESRWFYRRQLETLAGRRDDFSRAIVSRISDSNRPEYMRFLSPRDARFINRLIDSDFSHPSLPYLVNYIDMKDAPVFLSKMILERIPDFDRIELEHIRNLRPDRAGDYWTYMAHLDLAGSGDVMQNYQQWLNAVGSLLYLIWDSNKGNADNAREYNACLTEQFFAFARDIEGGRIRNRSDLAFLFRYLKSPEGDAKALYQCIWDSFSDGRMLVPEGAHGRLTYFIRQTSSVGASW